MEAGGQLHTGHLTPKTYPGALLNEGCVVPLRSAHFGEMKISGIWVAERQYYVLSNYLLKRQK
jgi:hypothetical protein